MQAENAKTEMAGGNLVSVLIPVFEDWAAADVLLQRLDEEFGKKGIHGEILFVDDGSQNGIPEWFPSVRPRNLVKVRILELRKNVGHQRAICVGLVCLQKEEAEGAVLIMDADGEDAPADVSRLLQEFAREKRKVIFAERGRRAEGLVFKTFYQLYRLAHRVLVGFDIRIGNFSVLPKEYLDTLVVSSELWNHYAAAVIKTKLPVGRVRVDRAKRVYGQSSMGFIGLVVHGLSAMSVFGDSIGTRLLMVFSGFAVLTMVLIFITAVVRLATNLAIPGWATYTAGLLLLLLFQSLTLALVFTFIVLNNRSQSNFIPLRDCPYYVRGMRTILETHD
jgi:polyisoprenyl-phosphate glycosyltransferase